jgi:hypothetical protein
MRVTAGELVFHRFESNFSRLFTLSRCQYSVFNYTGSLEYFLLASFVVCMHSEKNTNVTDIQKQVKTVFVLGVLLGLLYW